MGSLLLFFKGIYVYSVYCHMVFRQLNVLSIISVTFFFSFWPVKCGERITAMQLPSLELFFHFECPSSNSHTRESACQEIPTNGRAERGPTMSCKYLY